MSRFARIFFSFIFVAYAAILSLLQQVWGMSASQAGLVQSGWHAGYVVSLFCAGLLADRIGARRTFLGMSVAACMASSAFAAFADGALSALVLYTLAGVFAGGSYTPVLALIAHRFPPATRGRAMGWFLAAGPLGYALGLAASGPLVAWGGQHPPLRLNPDEVASVRRIRLLDIAREDAVVFDSIPESERRVVRLHVNGRTIHAPTAALIYQFREVLAGRQTRVADLEQPVFAWR